MNKALPLLLLGGAAVAVFAMSGKNTKTKKRDNLKTTAPNGQAKSNDVGIEILIKPEEIENLLVVAENGIRAGVSLDEITKSAFDAVAPGQKPDDYITNITMVNLHAGKIKTNPAELYYNLYVRIRAIDELEIKYKNASEDKKREIIDKIQKEARKLYEEYADDSFSFFVLESIPCDPLDPSSWDRPNCLFNEEN